MTNDMFCDWYKKCIAFAAKIKSTGFIRLELGKAILPPDDESNDMIVYYRAAVYIHQEKMSQISECVLQAVGNVEEEAAYHLLCALSDKANEMAGENKPKLSKVVDETLSMDPLFGAAKKPSVLN